VFTYGVSSSDAISILSQDICNKFQKQDILSVLWDFGAREICYGIPSEFFQASSIRTPPCTPNRRFRLVRVKFGPSSHLHSIRDWNSIWYVAAFWCKMLRVTERGKQNYPRSPSSFGIRTAIGAP